MFQAVLIIEIESSCSIKECPTTCLSSTFLIPTSKTSMMMPLLGGSMLQILGQKLMTVENGPVQETKTFCLSLKTQHGEADNLHLLLRISKPFPTTQESLHSLITAITTEPTMDTFVTTIDLESSISRLLMTILMTEVSSLCM